MKLHPRKALSLLAALAACFALPGALNAAVGELRLSGSTWTGKVDGVTKYTGANMSAAGNACVAAMSSGTLRIYNGGNTGGTINLKSNVNVDGWGNTLTGVTGAANGVFQARNASNSGGKNVRCAGGQWFGMWFRSCATQTFTGISGGAGILLRIDNGAGSGGSNFNAGSPNCTASGGHGVETLGITGTTFGTITAVDRSGGCGIMFNPSKTARGTTVNATRCNRGGHYAAFRAGTSSDIVIGTVNATTCGRGVFTLVNPSNITVTRLYCNGATDVAAWLESSTNVHIDGGEMRNIPDAKCYWISNGGSGSYVRAACIK